MGRFLEIQKAKAADIKNIGRFVDEDELESAIGEGGAITTAIESAVSAGITAAIGEGGAIETWADGRYAAKSGG